MHVGLVVYGGLDRVSGGYRYDRKLRAGLERRGDEVEVIALPEPSSSKRVAPEAIRARLDRPFDVLLQDELCYRSLVDLNPELGEPSAVVALVHLLESAAPDVRSESVLDLERRYLESVDAAVCTSTYTRDRTVELAAVPTTVAPPAGRYGGAASSATDVRERARDGPLRVAFVGNLVPRKNLETLLEALERLQPSWTLTVVGDRSVDPAYARTVRERVRSSGLDGCVAVRGRVEDAELERLLERSHVLAVPSRYEGFGMVYLEAMEYGVVPIASTVGGAGEFVADGRNGFLVDPDDPERIAGLLDRLACDRDRLATIGCAGLATAAAHPTWAETVDSIRSFLQRGVTVGFRVANAEDSEGAK